MLTPDRPELSVVVPAYDAHTTISETLESLYAEDASRLEVIVVDDGSPEQELLERALAAYPRVRLVRHQRNRGMVAARNSGIEASTGRFITILDADDRFVAGWQTIWQRIRESWPSDTNVCFSACRDPWGGATVAEPSYEGPLTFRDALNERRSGEYLPIFVGPYIRGRRYVDLGTRRSCGQVSYLRLLEDGPFWLTPLVLRIYNVDRPGSVSARWGEPDSAAQSVRCLDELLARYGEQYRRLAPHQWRRLHLKYAVYSRLSGQGEWFEKWRIGARPSTAVDAVAALAMLLFGRPGAIALMRLAKYLGLGKRYG